VARHAKSEERRRSRWLIAGGAVLVALAGAGVLFMVASSGSGTRPPVHDVTVAAGQDRGAASRPSTTTTTTTTTSTIPLPQPAGPGFVAGKVTAVGDSVMLDYQDALMGSIPGITVDAAVSRQWSDGESVLQTLKAQGELGADVIVGLSTNGPITDGDFDSMMAILGGASRVVFVNLHVDRPWQDANNAVLARGAARYHNVVVADWSTLAAQNPQWFGSDGTHLGINGPGAQALAALVTMTLANG
jgi:hypothetical protein